jgi:hypothetical protein
MTEKFKSVKSRGFGIFLVLMNIILIGAAFGLPLLSNGLKA